MRGNEHVDEIAVFNVNRLYLVVYWICKNVYF